MATNSRTRITVQAIVKAPVEKVWKYWNEPEHITHWSFASNDWHAPSATNDLRPGGKLIVRMEAKDGSAGFDFGGTYDVVKEHEEISFTMGDGRRVDIVFTAQGMKRRSRRRSTPKTRTPSNFSRRAGNPSWTISNGTRSSIEPIRKRASPGGALFLCVHGGRRPHYSADRCDSSTCLSTVSAFAARGHPA